MPQVNAREVILILIDISGYTKFMVSNKRTIHSQLVIGNILRSIIDEVDLPLRIAKLEGDAVFLYAVRRHDHSWTEEKRLIGQRLEQFFCAFADQLVKLTDSALCRYQSCKNLDKLHLKVFVHSGEALFQTIRGYEELAGVDVILVHRLLKNKLPYDHYILLTNSALKEIAFPHQTEMKEHEEKDPELGTISTQVYIPDDLVCPIHSS